MDESKLRELLERVQEGKTTASEAVEQLRVLPFEDLGFAKLDHHRALRSGSPEVVYAPGKSVEQLKAIAKRLADTSGSLLITRLERQAYNQLLYELPNLEYDEVARAAFIEAPGTLSHPGVLVLAGGTADLPVAEEAVVTSRVMGSPPQRIYDVGVAGLHRLLDHLEELQQANVVVVVAGMEGALPSVVAGLIAAPVIAVPTSIGYGASFGGIAPLLTMLNSCANGVSVVNIDNGFGAGYIAASINRLAARPD
ncbi:MAG TPA: nickel pincer cofactor biosynthesis protein LarB [Dehalococcoidia bacterium]|nr:nickel pincer cofactor biosynthesis protein LarB [Dehalococcoidia bacterium]